MVSAVAAVDIHILKENISVHHVGMEETPECANMAGRLNYVPLMARNHGIAALKWLFIINKITK